MTDSAYYTLQFYTWEYRGRGLHQETYPVALEPPFMPFLRHKPVLRIIDDGKRPSWLSSIADLFSRKQETVSEEIPALDYETMEAFPATTGTQKVVFHIKPNRDRKLPAADLVHTLLGILSNTVDTISFEIIGNATQIRFQFVCGVADAPLLAAVLPVYLPDCIIHKDTTGIAPILKPNMLTAVAGFALAEEFVRPLANYQNKDADAINALLGLLDSITGEEQLGLQILFQGCVNNWHSSIVHSVTGYDGKSFFLDAPEAPKLAIEKTSSPLFGVSIKLFAQGSNTTTREALFFNAVHMVRQTCESAYNSLIPVAQQDIQIAIRDIQDRTSHTIGMLLNAAELATVVHIPQTAIAAKKLQHSSRKTKPVPAIALNQSLILGTNNHSQTLTNITLSTDARLKHMHIIGATGTGKSTLIASMVLQDVQSGIGIALLDPHGDLIEDIMARMPEHRVKDVVLLDPTDSEYPIGLNILAAHTDIEKEILSSDLVASFRKFSTSWGDQMNTVLGNAIIAIVESTRGGTLHDLRRFLIEDSFRNEFLATVTDPAIRYYWLKEYPLSKGNAIGSILTRLDTFLRPKVIRNMVAQQMGLDFEQLLNNNKIIFIKLSQGLLGKENSYLLGSLMVTKLHQAAFARQQHSNRNPFFIYIDEFQNFITPSITEMFSGVRKYNIGLIVSHQELQQLQREDAELLNSVLGNIYTRIVFRVGEPDAKKLQDGLGDFDAMDMQNLGRGEAIIRIEQPQYTTSLDTIVLEPFDAATATSIRAAIVQYCRHCYATPRAIIEAALYKDLDLTNNNPKRQKNDIVKDENNISAAVTIEHIHTDSLPLLMYQSANENDIVNPLETVVDKATQAEEGNMTAVQPTTTKERDSTHRYLQNLVKKMAESYGYIATLEAAIPDGQVDVLLLKDNSTIAIEISNTTEAEWEVHNIEKCIAAGFTVVISLSGDNKQLERIRKKCITAIADFERYAIHFFTPDTLFAFLQQKSVAVISEPQGTIIKGYRVNVSYDKVTMEEMKRKRASVAQVVMGSLRKKKQ